MAKACAYCVVFNSGKWKLGQMYKCVSDPDLLKMDTDPGFFLYPDPDPIPGCC
jgi:hypothetical protein